MKLPKGLFRAFTSLALALTVTTVFSLRSYAALDTPASEPPVAQDCTGTLTVASGTVTINGNPAQTGATVMSGSVVATSSGGKAVIDFGPAGRVEVGHHTTVNLSCAGGAIQGSSVCSKTEIDVTTGSVNVTTPRTETIAAGKDMKFDGQTSFTGAAGAAFKVECEGGPKAGGLLVGPGLIGLLALVGVGAAVAAGVALGEGDNASAGGNVSPVR